MSQKQSIKNIEKDIENFASELKIAEAKDRDLEEMNEERKSFLASCPSEEDIKKKELELSAAKDNLEQFEFDWKQSKKHMIEKIATTFGLNFFMFEQERQLSSPNKNVRTKPSKEALEQWIKNHVEGKLSLHHVNAKNLTLNDYEKKRFNVVKSYGQGEKTFNKTFVEDVEAKDFLEFLESAPVISYYSMACCTGNTGYFDSFLLSDVPSGYGVGKAPTGAIAIVVRFALKANISDKMILTLFERKEGCFIMSLSHEKRGFGEISSSLLSKPLPKCANSKFYDYFCISPDKVTIRLIMDFVREKEDDFMILC